MKVWKYSEARDKVLRDLDLLNETFVQSDEMVGYFNDAIEEAESEIHRLGVEDEYFRTKYMVPLVTNTSAYAMPTNIYANKIRKIVYSVGTNIYEVERLRRQYKEIAIADITWYGISDYYSYDIENDDSSTGMQLILYPKSRETSNTAMTLWYIREANKIPLISAGSQAATDAALIDIPQFCSFIRQYAKVKVAEKEGHPLLEVEMGVLQAQRKLMIDSLTEMVVDDNNTVSPDLTHYYDMS